MISFDICEMIKYNNNYFETYILGEFEKIVIL